MLPAKRIKAQHSGRRFASRLRPCYDGRNNPDRHDEQQPRARLTPGAR